MHCYSKNKMPRVDAQRVIEWLTEHNHSAIATVIQSEITNVADTSSFDMSDELFSVVEAYGCPLLDLTLTLDPNKWDKIIEAVKNRLGGSHIAVQNLEQYPQKSLSVPKFLQNMVLDYCSDLKFDGGYALDFSLSDMSTGFALNAPQKKKRTSRKSRSQNLRSNTKKLRKEVFLVEMEVWRNNHPAIKDFFESEILSAISKVTMENQNLSDVEALREAFDPSEMKKKCNELSFRIVDNEWDGDFFDTGDDPVLRKAIAAKIRAALHRWKNKKYGQCMRTLKGENIHNSAEGAVANITQRYNRLQRKIAENKKVPELLSEVEVGSYIKLSMSYLVITSVLEIDGEKFYRARHSYGETLSFHCPPWARLDVECDYFPASSLQSPDYIATRKQWESSMKTSKRSLCSLVSEGLLDEQSMPEGEDLEPAVESFVLGTHPDLVSRSSLDAAEKQGHSSVVMATLLTQKGSSIDCRRAGARGIVRARNASNNVETPTMIEDDRVIPYPSINDSDDALSRSTPPPTASVAAPASAPAAPSPAVIPTTTADARNAPTSTATTPTATVTATATGASTATATVTATTPITPAPSPAVIPTTTAVNYTIPTATATATTTAPGGTSTATATATAIATATATATATAA